MVPHPWKWQEQQHEHRFRGLGLPRRLPLGRHHLDLLAGAGLTAYRFSLEWSRIEPEEGEFSRASLDHYRRMLDGCRDRGLAPIVTLNHFTTPRWFHNDGSWRSDKAGDRFARYVELTLPVVQDAEAVITLNEPNLAA